MQQWQEKTPAQAGPRGLSCSPGVSWNPGLSCSPGVSWKLGYLQPWFIPSSGLSCSQRVRGENGRVGKRRRAQGAELLWQSCPSPAQLSGPCPSFLHHLSPPEIKISQSLAFREIIQEQEPCGFSAGLWGLSEDNQGW